MKDGDLRSVVHGKDVATLAGLELSAGQLDYLTHQGWAWMAPACVWVSDGEESQGMCHIGDEWSMVVSGLVLASHETFDMRACQHEWSTKPVPDALGSRSPMAVRAAAYAPTYEKYCEEFTAYVLTCLKDKKHIIAK